MITVHFIFLQSVLSTLPNEQDPAGMTLRTAGLSDKQKIEDLEILVD